jgi:hypothetical protein
MQNIFLIFGYGIPKDILKDKNYNFYLNTVFNKIYSIVEKNTAKQYIIFCGGKTDMFKPYKRSEADEMIRLFSALIKQRPFLKEITKNWLLLSENGSLSTLENLLNSKKIIAKRNIKTANLCIFCEQTREKRINILAKKLFAKIYKPQVIPIDFDVSPSRYLPSDFLAKKEKAELEHSRWALRSPQNLKKHHQIFTEKIEHFRKAETKADIDALKKWWEQRMKDIIN